MSTKLLRFSAFSLLVACGDSAPSEVELCADPLGGLSADACSEDSVFFDGTHLWVRGTATEWLQLSLAAHVEGEWVPLTNCSGRPAVCDAGEARVTVDVASGTVSASLRSERGLSVGGLRMEGRLELPGARAWLSNGWQSWSQSGVLAIAAEPDAGAVQRALALGGDAETTRNGREFSWFFTAATNDSRSFSAGATSARTFKPWFQIFSRGDALWFVATQGAGEQKLLEAGTELAFEPIAFEFAAADVPVLAKYASQLDYRTSTASAPLGWNSWYDLWDAVTAADVLENAEIAREMLAPFAELRGGERPLRIVVDDGWQQAWGVWEANEKFPGGMGSLAAELRDRGFRAGIWLAPLLVHTDTALYAEHPDWFIPGAIYPHLKNGEMAVLDATHPDAAAHLSDVISSLVSDGYDLLKIDFLFAGTFPGERFSGATPMEAYAESLRVIRDAAGETTEIVAVGAPPVASFPWVDAWRLGGDIALENFDISWFFVPNQARSIAARSFFCDHLLCDADPVLLRYASDTERLTGAWVVATAGGSLMLSDDLRNLPEAVRNAPFPPEIAEISLSGRAMVPQDFFPANAPVELTNSIADAIIQRSRHVVPQRWIADQLQLRFNFSDTEDAQPARSVRLTSRSDEN